MPEIWEDIIEQEPMRKGKVRIIHNLGDGRLAMVASNRLSTHDVVHSDIPGKGRLLTQMSLAATRMLRLFMGKEYRDDVLMDDTLACNDRLKAKGHSAHGSVTVVRETKPIPYECVGRMYVAGSAVKRYAEMGFPVSSKLPSPVFDPTTKEEHGHDQPTSIAAMLRAMSKEDARYLRDQTLDICRIASEYTEGRGLILVDTKFEFGRLPDGTIVNIDEKLTPDSSRYWPRESHQPGVPMDGFDKEWVRRKVKEAQPDGEVQPMVFGPEIIEGVQSRYGEAYARFTGKQFDWNA